MFWSDHCAPRMSTCRAFAFMITIYAHDPASCLSYGSFDKIQNYSSPRIGISREWLQQTGTKANNFFGMLTYSTNDILISQLAQDTHRQHSFFAGSKSFGFCPKEPRINWQNIVIWYRAPQSYTELILSPFFNCITIVSFWILRFTSIFFM